MLLGAPGLTGVARAASTTNGATLNGDSAVTVTPGSSIEAAVTTTSGNGMGNRVASIGWRIASTPPGSMTCVDVPDQSGRTAVTSEFPVTAPAAGGTYHAYFAAFSDNACVNNSSNGVTLTGGVAVVGPAASADLVMTKSDGVTSVVAGRPTTYTLIVRNEGPQASPAGVEISDPIPAGTTGSESETACSIAAGRFTCTTPATISVGGSVSYDVTLTVGAGFGGANLRNVATISAAPAADPVASNNTAVDVDAVTPGGVVSYDGLLAGPALADMYPVDVVDSGSFYYVVDPGRYRVVKIDRGTGQIVATRGGHQGRAKGQFGAARAIAADAAGNVYVADTPNNRIQVLSPDLAFVPDLGHRRDAAPGSSTWSTASRSGWASASVARQEEVVYTTDGGRVQKFTKTGTFLSQFGHGALNQPRQLAVHPVTHDLYVVSARDRQIVVFDQHRRRTVPVRRRGHRQRQVHGRHPGDRHRRRRPRLRERRRQPPRPGLRRRRGRTSTSSGTPGTGDQYLTDARGLTVTHDGIVVRRRRVGLRPEGVPDQRGRRPGASFVRFLFGGGGPVAWVQLAARDRRRTREQRRDLRGRLVEPADRRSSAPTARTASTWGRRGTTAEPGSINFAWDAAVDPATGNVFVANRESHEIEVFDAQRQRT